MNARVVVTFVGGPLHGTVRNCEAQETTIWHTQQDGQVSAYGQRGSGDARSIPPCVMYAPIGMADSMYTQLAALLLIPRPALGEGWH